jgi:DNA transposition AAA+ family ATPase
MKRAIAPVSNIVMMTQALQALTERGHGMPGIGLIYGSSGFGKTTALAFMRNRVNGVYLRAWPTWTPTSMLAKIMEELGLQPGNRIAPMIDAVMKALSMEQRTVFIDESDYLLERPILLETLRSLHDMTTTPLILVGMGEFKQNVMHREQLAGRVGKWVEFQGANDADTKLLAEYLCEVGIADDLLAEVHKKSRGGSVRRIVSGLWSVESLARKKGLKKISLAEWGDRPFTFGEPPAATRAAA